MTEKGRSEYRVDQQPAFVLHTYPWRETSLIVGAFYPRFTDVSFGCIGAQNDRCLNTADCLILLSPGGFLLWQRRSKKSHALRVVRDDSDERKSPHVGLLHQ